MKHLQIFFVVKFPEESSVSVVPSSWVIGDECFWPPYKSFKKIEECVKKCTDPEPTWQKVQALVMKSTDSYNTALHLEQKAMLTSDLNSEVEEDVPSRKKRRRTEVDLNEESEDEGLLSNLPPFPAMRPHPVPARSLQPNLQSSQLCSTVAFQQTPERIGETHSEILQRKILKMMEAKEAQDEIFQRKVLRKLEGLEQSIRDIQGQLKLQATTLHQTSIPSLPADCPHLPCQMSGDLVHLEELLRDDSKFNNMCDYLSVIGGDSTRNCTRRVMAKLISSSLAQHYNWKGTRGVKLAFSGFKLINRLILGTVRKNSNCTMATELDVQNAIKAWLMHAKDRDGGRSNRAQIQAVQNPRNQFPDLFHSVQND